MKFSKHWSLTTLIVTSLFAGFNAANAEENAASSPQLICGKAVTPLRTVDVVRNGRQSEKGITPIIFQGVFLERRDGKLMTDSPITIETETMTFKKRFHKDFLKTLIWNFHGSLSVPTTDLCLAVRLHNPNSDSPTATVLKHWVADFYPENTSGYQGTPGPAQETFSLEHSQSLKSITAVPHNGGDYVLVTTDDEVLVYNADSQEIVEIFEPAETI